MVVFTQIAIYLNPEYPVFPPKAQKKFCQKKKKRFGIPAVMIDGNNINVEIISYSKKIPVDKKTARLALLDNPMGQDEELTPFIIVRKEK